MPGMLESEISDPQLHQCPWCYRRIDASFADCIWCGGTQTCWHCGAAVRRKRIFCGTCGERVPQPTTRSLGELYDDLGRALLQHERYEDAAKAFEQALKEADSATETWPIRANLALACERTGALDQALRNYLRAVNLAQHYASLLLSYAHELLTPALVAVEEQMLLQFGQDLLTYANLKPSARAEIAIFMGRTRLSLGDYGSALQLYRQAEQLHSGDPRVQEGLGEAYWRTGDLEQAISTLQYARQLAASDRHHGRLAMVQVKLAQVLAAAGRYDEALRCLPPLKAVTGTYASDSLYVRAQSLLALGRIEDALAVTEEAIQHTPAAVAPHLLRLQALIRLKRYAEASSAANQALQYDPAHEGVALAKIRALVEGQIDLDQARNLLSDFYGQIGSERLVRQLGTHAAQSDDGNLRCFFAFVYVFLAQSGMPDAGELAVEHATAAISLGLSGVAQSYPEALAYQLQAEGFDATGTRDAAAQAWYETGRRYSWRQDYAGAVPLFERAIERDPNHAYSRWELAEALRMQSNNGDSALADRTLLDRSLKIWETGTALQLPDANYSWVYVSRALINGDLTNQPDPPHPRLQLLYEAILYLERAIIIQAQDPYRWFCLGRYHQGLENWSTGIYATTRALEYGPENTDALEEHIVTLTNSGNFDAAEAYLDKRDALNPVDETGERVRPWLLAMRAYIKSRRGQYQEALALISRAIGDGAVSDYNLWFYVVRALCYRMLEQPERAAADYTLLLSRYRKEDRDNWTRTADAAYRLSKFDQMNEILALLAVDTNDTLETLRLLGLRDFATGDYDSGETELCNFIRRTHNPRELTDLQQFDLIEFTSQAKREPKLRVALDHVEAALREQLAKLMPLPSPVDELSALMAAQTAEGEVGHISWIAASASLARHYAAQQAWRDAATIYLQLSSHLPENTLALRQIVDQARAAGLALARDGTIDQAVGPLLDAAYIASTALPDLHELRAGVAAELGCIYLSKDDAANAHRWMAESLLAYRDSGIAAPAGMIAGAWEELITNTAHYWILDDRLASLAGDMILSPDIHTDLAAIRDQLLSALDARFKLAPQPSERDSLTVMPIALELAPALIPEDTSNNWSLFKSYIPNMRARIQQQMGISVAGVRVRENRSLFAGGFKIYLDEVPHYAGSVPLDERYLPLADAPLKLPELEYYTEAPNPVTGEPGFWIWPEDWDVVLAHGYDLWEEPLRYIVYQLEAVLCQNLARFLGIQDVAWLIENWAASDPSSTLIAIALPTLQARVRFAWVLRTLARERVPITSWQDILAAAHDAGIEQAPPGDVVRAVRLRLRAQLPGNCAGVRHIVAPEEWEAAVRQEDANSALSMTGRQLSMLIEWLHTQLDNQGWNCALIVRSPLLRPVIAGALANEFPFLHILAEEELLPPVGAPEPADSMSTGVGTDAITSE